MGTLDLGGRPYHTLALRFEGWVPPHIPDNPFFEQRRAAYQTAMDNSHPTSQEASVNRSVSLP